MYDMKTDVNYVYIKRILHFVDDWKFDFFLTNKQKLRHKKLQNDNDIVRWTYKNPERLELVIKNYSQELKKMLIQELNNVNCGVKFFPLNKDEYKVVIRLKIYRCSIL